MINILQLEMDLLTNFENFDKICRICLELSKPLTSISLYNIINMIKACASVEIWLNDELPNQICKICLTRLQDSFDFKQLCEKSDNNLRQVLNNCKNVKCEISVNDGDEPIVSKYLEIQNSRKDSDEQTQDSFVEDRDEQTLYDHENRTEICDEKTFSNNNENSEICDVQMFPKRDILDEYDVEDTFAIKNEALDLNEEIQEDNTVESKETEKSPRCVEPDKSEKLYTCEQCGRNCKNIRSFRYHMRRTHKKKSTKEPEKSFACEQCDGKFQNAPGLGYHARRVHKAEGTKCRFCSIIYYHEEHLKFHEDSHTRSIFKCDVCNRTFSHRFKVIRHMNSHKTERRYYCVQCDISFKSHWMLKKHNKTTSHERNEAEKSSRCDDPDKSEKLYTCEQCGRNYENIHSFRTHVRRAHKKKSTKEPEKPFACEQCDGRFEKARSLSSHLKRVHKVEGTKCSYCSLICYHPTYLEIHEQLHKDSSFKCEICNKVFSIKFRLDRHMSTHSTERLFHCSQCDLSFKTDYVLKIHVQNVHLGMRKYTACHICGKSVNTNHLPEHLSIHGERKTFTCELCDKKFVLEQSLKIHVQRTHEKSARKCRRLCNICGLGTISDAELRAHMRTHTGEKPYNCDKCDKKFTNKSQLRTHMSRTHFDERKYVCSVCSRGFYDSTTLKNHMRTHTGERPFQCQICEKAFGFKAALYTHMKMHTK